MASPDIFKSMHDKLFEDFKSQDVENGYFDVCFKIGEKFLHAHKVILAAVSKPLDVMFANRWTTKDQPIELTSYSHDDYKELLTFIYSGSCTLNNNNIINLLDMAESYDIPDFKSYCDAYLAKRPFTVTYVFQYVEIARRYSLAHLDEALKKYVAVNFRALLESEQFMKCKKAIVEAFVDYAGELGEGENEYCFSRVLEWAQKQAEIKMKDSDDENYDGRDGIYGELSGILLKFKFSKMSHLFLVEHVAKQSYLFSGEEFSDLLLSSRKIFLTVTNNQGYTVSGKIPYNQEIFEVLSPIKKTASSDGCWNSMRRRIPKSPSSLKKDDKIPFYLVLKNDGYVCLRSNSNLFDTDYLIAEMKRDDGFWISPQCTLHVFSNF